MRTEQEQFWAGEFGDDYVERNRGAELVAANRALFARILSRTNGVDRVLELGANIGQNLAAIQSLLPAVQLSAVEINETAAAQLDGWCDVHVGSLLDFPPRPDWDLVFTKGVLIHLPPERLGDAYDVLHKCSRRYICVAEYYNPSPVEVSYRGHSGRLFKRDFAGELLERFDDLQIVDYGFVYRRDPVFPLDDVTWFLLARR